MWTMVAEPGRHQSGQFPQLLHRLSPMLGAGQARYQESTPLLVRSYGDDAVRQFRRRGRPGQAYLPQR